VPALNDGQLSLDWQTFEALDVPVKVIQAGGQQFIRVDRPAHTHIPRRPPAIRHDRTWLRMLAYAEEQIRWASTRAVPDLARKPAREITGGICGDGYRLDINSRGCNVPLSAQKATWPQLLAGLAAQRSVEPGIARARDLADAYHHLDYFGRVYRETDFLGKDQTVRGSWRADRFIAEIAREVLELGGDLTLVPIHSSYMRAGVDVALGRCAAPWEEPSS
jgi:hypothetical protein